LYLPVDKGAVLVVDQQEGITKFANHQLLRILASQKHFWGYKSVFFILLHQVIYLIQLLEEVSQLYRLRFQSRQVFEKQLHLELKLLCVF
jgi:hypothetical protein